MKMAAPRGPVFGRFPLPGAGSGVTSKRRFFSYSLRRGLDAMLLSRRQLVELGSEDEIVLGEAAGIVSPKRKLHTVVVNGQIRVMVLRLCQLGHPVDEHHRRL